MAKDNELIGELILDGIKPMKKGEQKIEITFDLDVNNGLNITAVEKSSCKSNRIITDFKKGKNNQIKSKDNKIALFKKEKEEEKKK